MMANEFEHIYSSDILRIIICVCTLERPDFDLFRLVKNFDRRSCIIVLQGSFVTQAFVFR